MATEILYPTEIDLFLRSGMSQGMKEGLTPIPGEGQKWTITYGGGPAIDPKATISISLLDEMRAEQTIVGTWPTGTIEPTFVRSYGTKVYMLAGPFAHFSAVDDPMTWIDPDGDANGYVNLTNQASTPEDVIAMVQFQGRIAFFARQTTQVWVVTTDETQWQLAQTLVNFGIYAKNSVQPTGEIDALLLSDTGIRSLRSRTDNGNAFVDDIGSAIDSIITQAILDDPQRALKAVSIVEPQSLRYWLFLNGTIYVLSYFPSSKVVAWSTYLPTDEEGFVFEPRKFIVFKGQVFANDGDFLYRYGGVDGKQYDTTVVTVELPWLDMKNPVVLKQAEGIQAVCPGRWSIQLGMDPQAGEDNVDYDPDLALANEPVLWEALPFLKHSTYGTGTIPYTAQGTHFKARMVTAPTADPAKFSSLAFRYRVLEEE